MALFDLPPKPEPQFWKWLTRLGAVLSFGSVMYLALLLFWPAEGDRPFDSAVWKENINTLDLNIRTSMRKDLVERIKKERWSPARVVTELGAGDVYVLNNCQRMEYALGHRRGAWPFRSFGVMTAFDPCVLQIHFDENGVFLNANAIGS